MAQWRRYGPMTIDDVDLGSKPVGYFYMWAYLLVVHELGVYTCMGVFYQKVVDRYENDAKYIP